MGTRTKVVKSKLLTDELLEAWYKQISKLKTPENQSWAKPHTFESSFYKNSTRCSLWRSKGKKKPLTLPAMAKAKIITSVLHQSMLFLTRPALKRDYPNYPNILLGASSKPSKPERRGNQTQPPPAIPLLLRGWKTSEMYLCCYQLSN